MLPPPTLRCRHRRHAATALPNMLPLLPKLRFRQVAASAAKLAATTALPPPCYHCLQNKGKIYNTVDLPFFHHDGNGSKQ
jgi:hypothetical protein